MVDRMDQPVIPYCVLLENAIELAVKAHKGQRDKQGEPYILHLLRVMFNVHGYEARIVAVLHDLLEDTEYTANDLLNMGYSRNIVHAIMALTREDSESYEDYVKNCKNNYLAKMVKIEDIDDHIEYNHNNLIGDMRRIKYRKAYQYLTKSDE